MTDSTLNTQNSKLTYEEASKALAELVAKLEKGDLSLEQTIKTYEEAKKVSAYCVDLLEKAKLKITEVSAEEP